MPPEAYQAPGYSRRATESVFRKGARLLLSQAIEVLFLEPQDLVDQLQEARAWV